jgi:CBS domain-containing protein
MQYWLHHATGSTKYRYWSEMRGLTEVPDPSDWNALVEVETVNIVRYVNKNMALNEGVRVEDVMSTPLETISKGATITTAAKAMRENEINALVVTTSPPSIVTSTDILDAVANGHDPTSLQVSDIMTTDVETVSPDFFLEEIAAMMTSYGINHFPVVNVNDEYIGMVSSTDVTAQLS